MESLGLWISPCASFAMLILHPVPLCSKGVTRMWQQNSNNASRRHVAVTPTRNWMFLSANELVTFLPGTDVSRGILSSLHAFTNCGAWSENANTTFLFPMNPLDIQHYVFCSLALQWKCLNHTSEPNTNDQQFPRVLPCSQSIHVCKVKCDKVAPLLQFSSECSSFLSWNVSSLLEQRTDRMDFDTYGWASQ